MHDKEKIKMKKKFGFYGLTLFFSMFLFSCYSTYSLKDANKVRPNMSMEDVRKIMGEPTVVEFIGDVVEEWHYCKTANGFNGTTDRYTVYFFYKNKVVSKLNYSVSVHEAGGYGDCSNFVRRGSYSVPSIVTEIINKNKRLNQN